MISLVGTIVIATLIVTLLFLLYNGIKGEK